MEKYKDRTWAEINLNNLMHNVQTIKSKVDEKTKTMWVVKADAYGHGAAKISQAIEKSGADYFAVATIDEAIYLRKNHIKTPILVLSSVATDRVAQIAENNITVGVFSVSEALRLSNEAKNIGSVLKIHIALDTGMGRVGLRAYCQEYIQETVEQIKQIISFPYLFVEGIFTHFAVADEENPDYTMQQYKLFRSVVDTVRKQDLPQGVLLLAHCANSAAIIRFPQMHMDMVRAGIILYGLSPSEYMKKYNFDIKPVMTVKSRITHVKKIESPLSLSYGCTFEAKSGSYVATVPIGYADGYRRTLSNKGNMLINGMIVPVRGRVCMDQLMVDVSELFETGNEVCVGDEIEIFGDGQVTADSVAALCGTINYDITSGISSRVPRIYIEANKPNEYHGLI